MTMEEHPTVKWFREEQQSTESTHETPTLEALWLKQLCIEAGADDVGISDIDRPALAEQRQDLLELMPGTKAVVSLMFRLNRESLQTEAHSVTNLEFRHQWAHANSTNRAIVSRLQDKGIRALNAPAGFPYEADQWPGKMWLTCDKLLAVEAGLGHMGWNRMVIHPEFGDCVVIGNVLVEADVGSYDHPIDYNPCIECKLCVSICPVGAVCADGHFDFISCYTHNYRERLGGFSDWIENVIRSKSVRDYRERVGDSETISMWQNLSIGPQTRCDRCMAVCPAGREVIGEFLTDRKGYTERTVKKARGKSETIYVVPDSDAESHMKAKFPGKTVKRVSNGIRPKSASSFLFSLPIAFQRNQSEGLDATFHFTFTGEENCRGTAVIRDRTIDVKDDHVGTADLHVTADSRTWTGFLAKEKSLAWAMISRKIKIKGSPKLMMAFAKCFPS
ncbi:SCP2 sterol-binding domain-containing protein [Thermodesulfobacteriota bacterium]